MTELDEYVWRKDGAYGFDVGKFASRERQNNLFNGQTNQSYIGYPSL